MRCHLMRRNYGVVVMGVTRLSRSDVSESKVDTLPSRDTLCAVSLKAVAVCVFKSREFGEKAELAGARYAPLLEACYFLSPKASLSAKATHMARSSCHFSG